MSTYCRHIASWLNIAQNIVFSVQKILVLFQLRYHAGFPAYLQAGVGKARNETINVNKDPSTTPQAGV